MVQALQGLFLLGVRFTQEVSCSFCCFPMRLQLLLPLPTTVACVLCRSSRSCRRRTARNMRPAPSAV